MFSHIELGGTPEERRKNVARLIRKGEVSRAGYRKAKIYGLLRCKSGMRMKMENRVFFKNEEEAIHQGYRPCAHCLPGKYKQWKHFIMNLNHKDAK